MLGLKTPLLFKQNMSVLLSEGGLVLRRLQTVPDDNFFMSLVFKLLSQRSNPSLQLGVE